VAPNIRKSADMPSRKIDGDFYPAKAVASIRNLRTMDPATCIVVSNDIFVTLSGAGFRNLVPNGAAK